MLFIIMSEILRFADMTNHKKIFKLTYWGDFSMKNRKEDVLLNAVFFERNRFVEDYDIKRLNRRCYKLDEKIQYNYFKNHKSYYDHVEFYITNDKNKYVVIISPYCNIEETDLEFYKQMLDWGWRSHPRLYCDSAHTYILEITKQKFKTMLFDKFNY